MRCAARQVGAAFGAVDHSFVTSKSPAATDAERSQETLGFSAFRDRQFL
jgi:hypothetical protein